jgi:outer membrane receptor protein involved in Fe transport
MGYQDTLTNYASLAAFNTLLSAPGGGTGICAGGYNPFGVNPISASCLQYLGRTGHNNTVLEQDVLEGDAQGKLFDLPAGELRFAVGADYRKNTYRLDVDSLISAGDFANTPAAFSTRGETNVKELYLELLAPVVRDLPLAKEVNLDLGYRYSDYNISGGVSTYKIDADWKMVDWLTVRGGYARATRAPSVGDLFQGITGSQVSIGSAGQFASGDPCDATGAYLNPAKNPDFAKVQALCTAQGTPTGFTNNQPRPPSTTQGNIDLRPESADTFSIGTVLRPNFESPLLSKISLSVDYYSIDVKDTMGTIGANAILDNCYTASTNPTYSLDNQYCKLLSRSPTTGLIANISNPLLNLGEYKTSGVDVQADWAAPLTAFGAPEGWGTVSLNVLLNYLDKFTIQSTPTSPVLDFAGTIGNTQVDTYADAHPQWKATTTLGWEVGPVRSSFRWRYLDGMKNFAFVGTTSSGPGAPAVSYFDLDVAWKVRPNLQLRAGMTNVFDKAPPVLPFMSAGTDLYTYDIIGRRMFVSLKANF